MFMLVYHFIVYGDRIVVISSINPLTFPVSTQSLEEMLSRLIMLETLGGILANPLPVVVFVAVGHSHDIRLHIVDMRHSVYLGCV